MNNIRQITLSLKFNDRVTMYIDNYNYTVHRLTGYAEKSGNPVYKDSYYGTFQKAVEGLLSDDVLADAELDEMTVREYLELENECRKKLEENVRALLQGDPVPCDALLEKIKIIRKRGDEDDE